MGNSEMKANYQGVKILEMKNLFSAVVEKRGGKKDRTVPSRRYYCKTSAL